MLTEASTESVLGAESATHDVTTFKEFLEITLPVAGLLHVHQFLLGVSLAEEFVSEIDTLGPSRAGPWGESTYHWGEFLSELEGLLSVGLELLSLGENVLESGHEGATVHSLQVFHVGVLMGLGLDHVVRRNHTNARADDTVLDLDDTG